MLRKDHPHGRSRKASSKTEVLSRDARAGETLADFRVIVSLFGWGAHEFIEHCRRDVEKLIDPALHKLDLERLRVFLIAHLGNFRRGNREPIHFREPPFW